MNWSLITDELGLVMAAAAGEEWTVELLLVEDRADRGIDGLGMVRV